MSFPDDVNEKVKLQREEEEQNQQKSAQFNVSKFHIMISFFSNNALLEAFFSWVNHFDPCTLYNFSVSLSSCKLMMAACYNSLVVSSLLLILLLITNNKLMCLWIITKHWGHLLAEWQKWDQIRYDKW